MVTRLVPIGALLVAAILQPRSLGADEAPLVKVTGVVRLDGRPLPGATVAFLPLAKDGRKATGKTDKEGKYEMTTKRDSDGAEPGKYQVTISLIRDGKELIPVRYSDKEKSPLQVEVPPGKTSQLDFELASR
jgi:hypothetical protein